MDFNYVEIGLGALSLVLGFLGARYRGKFVKIKTLVTTFFEALEDEKISKEELDELIRQVKAL